MSRKSRLDDTSEAIEITEIDHYSPPEWNALPTEAKVKLAKLMTWENLSKWEFNIVEVAELTSDPLLLLGWTILCGSTAQDAVSWSIGVEGDAAADLDGDFSSDNITASYHYHFHEQDGIDPRTICNFLREIERRYEHDNPYHNNVHAADVVQTTHCLFQLMGEEYARRIFGSTTIFSLILAATFHDVGHPGTNNIFQKNAMTSLAIEYNNQSILENMHLAVGFSLLFGEEKRDEWDIFESWTHTEKVHARKIMTTSILATDMQVHNRHKDQLTSLIDQVRILEKETSDKNTNTADIRRGEPPPILSILVDVIGEPKSCKNEDIAHAKLEGMCDELCEIILRYMLHSADISNGAKSEDLALYWSNRVYDEFFAQGDKEKKMGLPISPLCDRDTVIKAESQIGFNKFVVQPLYELLGIIIPRVNEEVMPLLVRNMEFWEEVEP